MGDTMNEIEVVDRFLKLRQRMELLGGTIIISGKYFKFFHPVSCYSNIIHRDLDEVEKTITDLEKCEHTQKDYFPN
jgi:hypothetical protein